VAGVRLAIGREVAKDQEDVDIGILTGLSSRPRPEQRGLPQFCGHLSDDPMNEKSDRANFPARQLPCGIRRLDSHVRIDSL
jgi:hypothetical protein